MQVRSADFVIAAVESAASARRMAGAVAKTWFPSADGDTVDIAVPPTCEVFAWVLQLYAEISAHCLFPPQIRPLDVPWMPQRCHVRAL